MKKRHQQKPPPWTEPWRVGWFVLALVFSCWIILHMPPQQHTATSKKTSTTQQKSTAQSETTSSPSPTVKTMHTETAQLNDASKKTQPTTQKPTEGELHQGAIEASIPNNTGSIESPKSAQHTATTHTPAPPAEASSHKGSSAEHPIVDAPLAPPSVRNGETLQEAATIHTALQEKGAVLTTPSAPSAPSAFEQILAKWKTFGRLFMMVGIAAFFGGIMEARRWHLVLVRSLGRLTKAARMPSIVGVTMPTALYSNVTANSLLVSSHAEGRVPMAALIAGGMLNSYMAYISHSLRVLYPVIGLIGITGVVFFSIQFIGNLLVILVILLWHYHHTTPQEADEISDDISKDMRPVKPWNTALALGAKRSATLMFRMVCLTVPLMLGVEWVIKSDMVDFWDGHLPEWVATYFPAELLSVVVAQLGGWVQSSAVAANLRAEGLITSSQILLAMLIASIVGSPFRTLRRNLPSALATFTMPVALSVVLGMQFARLLVNCIAAGCIIYSMYYFS